MMSIDSKMSARLAEEMLVLAISAWIEHQWHAGLVKIEALRTLTEAEQPDFGELVIRLEEAMLEGIITLMLEADPDSTDEPEVLLVIKYVQQLLSDELARYNVAPTLVRSESNVSRQGDEVLINFTHPEPTPETKEK